MPRLTGVESVGSRQNIEFAGVILLLFGCQKIQCVKNVVAVTRIEVKEILGSVLIREDTTKFFGIYAFHKP